jgi:transposase
MVSHDQVPWNTAYQRFRDRTADGARARVHDSLRDQVRLAEGRDRQPSAAILNSQSAESSDGGRRSATTPVGGPGP